MGPEWESGMQASRGLGGAGISPRSQVTPAAESGLRKLLQRNGGRDPCGACRPATAELRHPEFLRLNTRGVVISGKALPRPPMRPAGPGTGPRVPGNHAGRRRSRSRKATRAPAIPLPRSGRYHRGGPLRRPAKVSSPACDWPAARGRGLRSPFPRARARSPHCEPVRERAPW